jgi:hypothetical protein
MRIRSKNMSWLVILGSMVGLAVLPGGLDPAASGLLVALFGASAAATLLEFQPARLVERSRSSLNALRMSQEAREATERARRRGGSPSSGVLLLDVGLIAAQDTILRLERNLSKDDDGARPYVVLQVPPEVADRRAVIRFEFLDPHGAARYVHEIETYLRDGEMKLLPDHQMRLYGNDDVRLGDWDLRVSVDGRLLGAHTFTVTPSLEDRYPAAARERAARRLAAQEGSQSAPTPARLEDLLRDQSQRQERR